MFTDYKGTSVKDITKFRQVLRKENIFQSLQINFGEKSNKKEAGVQGEIADYKAPVILSVSTEDETGPAAELKTCLKKLRASLF